MKQVILCLLSGILLAGSGCSDVPADLPTVAVFTFDDDNSDTFAMATYDACPLSNQSEGDVSVYWDFGDGRSSTEREPVLSYETAGAYTVTLTITNADGEQSTTSKSIVIKDRVLKRVEVSNVYWDVVNTNAWPTTEEVAEVWLQIQEFTDIAMTNKYLCADCPVVYTSPSVFNIKHSDNGPFTIPTPGDFVVDKKLVQFAHPENVNNAYLITLMAKDAQGNIFRLQDNRGGGGHYFGILNENFALNRFVVQVGPFSDYHLVCEFE